MLDVRGSQNLAILRWLRTRMSSKPWLLCSPKIHSGKFPYFHDRCLSYSNLCGCQKIGPSLGCDRFICHGSPFAKGVNPPLLRTKRRVILLPQRPTTALMPLVPRNSRAANVENEERDTKPSWPDSLAGPTKNVDPLLILMKSHDKCNKQDTAWVRPLTRYPTQEFRT